MAYIKSQCVYWLSLSTLSWLGVATQLILELKTESQDKSLNYGNGSRIVFIVLSQSADFHVKEAENFRDYFSSQLHLLEKSVWPKLIFTHKDFSEPQGSWTIFTLIGRLVEFSKETDWFFICEEDTRVHLEGLVTLLRSKNPSERLFLGRQLRDHDTTIIHHFAFAEDPSSFAYPDFRAGFVLSIALIQHLNERLKHEKLDIEFSIDPKHEFALFVWDKGRGSELINLKEFCSVDESSSPWCVTRQPSKFPDCGHPIKEEDLFVAVKTCEKFHQTRIPVVKSTWGKKAKLIEYFSEIEDVHIPTTNLGVSNTEHGHCGKTMAIIRRIANAHSSVPWLLIADDDTLINLDRLRSLLACFDSGKPVALGERYGYALARGGGYDYITGGGGMVFSQPVLKILSSKCRCHSDDAPDDMTLGMCLKAARVPVTHSRFFHQARPDDYSQEFLQNQLPVSFHKHWNTDPYKVYADLMSASGASSGKSQEKSQIKVEL